MKASTTWSRGHAPNLSLACRECQRKKTRCDRTFPCGQCSRAGIQCTPSSRKARAKVGARAVDADLRDRIAKLEKLVETFQGGDGAVPDSNASSTSEPHPFEPPGSEDVALTEGSSPSTQPSASSSKFVASTFWSSLIAEVQAIKETFDEDDPEDDVDAVSVEPSPPQPSSIDPAGGDRAAYELILCPPGALYIMPGAEHEPSSEVTKELTWYFLEYLEPRNKLFHLPTLQPWLLYDQSYLGNEPDAPCNRALRMSIFFAGTSTLTEEESQSKFHRSKDSLVQEFRCLTDIALYRANPLNSTEMATLQAFVVYVGTIRSLDSSRRAWTMVGLLVRIACALNVHREHASESIYQRELRRRLWNNIAFLDCHASFDRGSDTVIRPDAFDRQLPSNVNDTDFDESTTVLHPREGEVTDMSFSMVSMRSSQTLIRISALEVQSSHDSWQQRLELATSYANTVNEKYLKFLDPQIPAHKMLIGIARATMHTMILRAVRPMQHTSSAAPPPVSTPFVLQLAVNTLRQCDELFRSKSETLWRHLPWVPWHAIAVALAGLITIRDTELAEEAWYLANISMERYGAWVADSRSGMLWQPIEKLRRRVAALRDADAAKALANTSPSQPIGLGKPLVPDLDVAPGSGRFLPMAGLDDLSATLYDNTLFNVHPDLLSPAADDNWLDWESIMKDMGPLNDSSIPLV